MPADWVYYSAQARHYSREPSIGSRELLSMRATDWTLHSHYAIVAGAIAIINLVSALQHRHGERRTGRNEGLTGPLHISTSALPPRNGAGRLSPGNDGNSSGSSGSSGGISGIGDGLVKN